MFSLCVSFCQEVDSVFTLLSAVLHIGDLHFTALTDADTAFPSDLQLLERGQCSCHHQGHISQLGKGVGGWNEAIEEGWITLAHFVYLVLKAPPPFSLGVLLGSLPGIAAGQTVTCLVQRLPNCKQSGERSLASTIFPLFSSSAV